MAQPLLGRMALGACYYPEHWDRRLWEEDLVRMKQHGLSLVRIGDFAWSLYEPWEGEWHIGYFDDFLDLCERHDMQVLFCTPTAAPPLWLTHHYPEALNADRFRHPYQGLRRHFSYNAPAYRRLCGRMVEKLAKHYGGREIVVGWQIDNELNCEIDTYYAEADHAAFRTYLKEKYGSLEALNDALGRVFWSRQYSAWEEISLLGSTVNEQVDPHQALEEKLFFSESAIAHCAAQAAILRKYLPQGKFITTNGLFGHLDYNRLMDSGLDFLTYDSYPDMAFELGKQPHAPGNLNDRKWSWNLAWTRSASPVFGIAEQQSGGSGWVNRIHGPMPKPGQMRLWTFQSVAHGADFVSYFRWRTSPVGCEIYWEGLNDYANADNRRLRELSQIGQEMARLTPICGATYQAKVAVLKDYPNAFDTAADLRHQRLAYHSDDSWFAATQRSHTPCDFLYLRAETTPEELDRYALLVYPHPAILEQGAANLLHGYVERGGTLIFGANTGYKDAHGRCPVRPLPGLVSAWCGLRVAEHTLLGAADDAAVLRWGDAVLAAPVYLEMLEPQQGEVEVLGRFEGGVYDGAPALCRMAVGKGMVYYLGACFSQEMVRSLLDATNQHTPWAHLLELPETVELAVRADGESQTFFVLNYGDVPAKIQLHQSARNLLDDTVHGPGVSTLPPYGVAVYTF